MAYKFSDKAGWMKTIEDVDPCPDSEKKALRFILSNSDNPEEALELIKALGIEEHLDSSTS